MYATRQLEEVYGDRVQAVFRRLEEALQPFAQALDDFLAVLFASRLPPDWRQRWHRFVAEQQLLGFTVEPQSVRELEAWIEAWARYCGLLPLHEVGAIPGAVADEEPLIPLNRPAPRSRLASERFFDQKLDEAHRHLYMLERALRALADKLEVAKFGVEVEVEADFERACDLVWFYNDALESARGEWLREKLSGDANTRLLQMRSPATLGLPAFVDREQAERARRQGLEVGKRLAGYDRSMDRLVATFEAIETTSTVAGIVLGAGVVATAVKTGGKWAIVKTAIAVGTGYALDKAIDKGLETAGASPQTIRGLRLAAVVFMLILIRRRGRAAPVESDVSAARRGETSESKESNALSPDSSKSSTGPRINEAGDHAKGDRARPQETEPSTASGPTDPVSKNPRVRNGGASSAAAGSLKPAVASENLQSLIASERRYWVRSVQFKGVKVYQRDDLIDPKLKVSGVTNIDRMRRGNAPIGPDQKPLNLHHLLQMEDGAVAEMTETFHNGYRRTLHINPPAIPSGIERQQFASYRVAYWKMRALDFEETRP